MLDKLRTLTGGNEERIQYYISLYIDVIPDYCSNISASIKEKELAALQQNIHACKSLFSTMGFDDLHKEAHQIETDILNKSNLESIFQRAESLNDRVNETIDLLKKI